MSRQIIKQIGWSIGARSTSNDGAVATALLRVVDAGLCGVICVAPFFFGGRHDLGRLVLVSLIAVTAFAWFIRQALIPRAEWTRTAANSVLLAAAALLALQLIPLPTSLIAILSPRTSALLPLWGSDGGGAAHLGTWRTLSLMPHATGKSLAMLASYGLLFTVVIGRVQDIADVRRLLQCIGVSSVSMAAFGLLQFFTSNGQFFWFYDHPYRTTQFDLCGSFINRNHFASFLVLGVGPLAAWLLETMSQKSAASVKKPARAIDASSIAAWLLAAALALVACAVLRSLSRGGAAALLTAATVFVAICFSRRLVDSRCIYGVGGLTIAVVGLLSLYGYDAVIQRLDDFTQGSVDVMDHDAGRRRIWKANFAAIQAGWLVGAGAGTHAEVYPVYLPESLTIEYTHAENGYLQVATENGLVGVALLAGGIGCFASSCVLCLRRATSPTHILCFAATAAGLAASLVHSAVDFVWYIPACISVTIVLAGCALRLSQFARSTNQQPAGRVVLSPSRWWELSAATLLAGAWAVYTFIGPGVAAVHWDRYLRASVAKSALARQQWSTAANQNVAAFSTDEPLNEVMLRHLEQVVAWDPHFARAHLRLAANYIAQFESAQQRAENAMSLSQIRDAAVASEFTSAQERQTWLHRAFGENVDLLRRADALARRALQLCPLQGEGYVLLSATSFLEGGRQDTVDACFAQALRVRPHDGDVLFEIGRQELTAGDLETGLDHWQKCFADHGPHQMKIVFLLTGRLPAAMFLSRFHPNWWTLREVWTRYRQFGHRADLEQLITYAAEAANQETQHAKGTRPMLIWYSLSTMYSDLGRSNEAVACLHRAYTYNPHHFAIRYALANALLAQQRYADAEAHVRWCLARRPEQKNLSAALLTIAKHRLAEHEVDKTASQSAGRSLVR